MLNKIQSDQQLIKITHTISHNLTQQVKTTIVIENWTKKKHSKKETTKVHTGIYKVRV